MLTQAAKATADLVIGAGDFGHVLPLFALLGAGVLLAFLLTTYKQPQSATGLVALPAMGSRHDSAMGQRDANDKMSEASEVVQLAGWQHSSAGATDLPSFADGRDTALASSNSSSSRGRDIGAYRRPLALSHRHDSSSTMPRTSTEYSLPSFKQAPAATDMRQQSGFSARPSVSAGSCNSTCRGQPCTRQRSSNASASKPSPDLQTDSPKQSTEQDSPLDLLTPLDQGRLLQVQQSPPATQQQSSPGFDAVFVPTSWTLASPQPLGAVSAPLAGLGLDNAASNGSQDQLPSIQSLSDPSVSRTVGKAPKAEAGPQQQEASDVTGGEQHTAAAAGHAAGSTTATTPTSSSSSWRSCASASDATPGPLCKPAAPSLAAAPEHGKAEAESAAAPSLDLATVLSPSPHSTSPGSYRAGHVYSSSNIRDTSAAAATAALSAAPTPATAARPPAASASAAPPGGNINIPARGHEVPAVPLAAPQVRPIGTCLPATPWAPAQRGLQGVGPSSLLYGAATASPLPTTALYKSPLQHVTLSVKVRALRYMRHCCFNLGRDGYWVSALVLVVQSCLGEDLAMSCCRLAAFSGCTVAPNERMCLQATNIQQH
jgi:hypothetical protein